eukprot:Protomagalhaensia_wolfi_Nauph_80__52@NODE_1031_length_1790_cov_819_432324_g726_i2_p1_GENE_NODE_1031_length_1790_cov_819_432324_g726_i2NODE_1031_length_1790_cov_819_432324_g726_i2_p1_ORF_typecomplete_len340_score49_17Aldo_ket_red/PF00248_21/1_8e07Aldo_ket_red/PF00248_21/5_9e35lci/PF12197_8/0_096_NODE_1031_length_1790_cov_819_432324_g726_i24951514
MSILCGQAHNGVLIPAIGFGTWRLPNDEATTDLVVQVLDHGCLHLDCAIVYNNQERIGQALRKFNMKDPIQHRYFVPDTDHFRNAPLEEYIANFGIPHGPAAEHRAASKGVFVTSKVFSDTFTADGVRWSVKESTRQLGRPIDLILLHWPVPDTKKLSDEELRNPALVPVRLECWRELEKLLAEKQVRAIGVSNFTEKHLFHIIQDVTTRRAAGDKLATIPMINQLEISPYCSIRKSLWDLTQAHRILTVAYSTLGPKDKNVLQDERIQRLASEVGVTPYQLVLRWALQSGYMVIPRSSKVEHALENQSLRFRLHGPAMALLNSLHDGSRDQRDPTLLA